MRYNVMAASPIGTAAEAATANRVPNAVNVAVPGADVQCTVICGDNRDILPTLPRAHYDLCITSPPYWQQRDYGAAGIGNEDSVDAYLDNLINTLALVLPVMAPTGSIVYNLGDKYVDGNLMLIPYRFAMRATDELGLQLINDITWVKQNPTPHQYDRRLTSSTEPFFHFAVSREYYYDRDAFAPTDQRQARLQPSPRLGARYRELLEQSDLTATERANANAALDEVIEDVRRGDLHSFRMKIRGLHAPAYGGQDGGRKIHIERDGFTIIRITGNTMKKDTFESPVESLKYNEHPAIYPVAVIRRLIRMLTPPGGNVLDHYVGSGTTLVAAAQEGRNSTGIDINPGYCKAAKARINMDAQDEAE